jgi:raffinose/stachyose/melibiose transport system permease protein
MNTIPQPVEPLAPPAARPYTKSPSSSIRLNKTFSAIASHAILLFFTVIIVYPVLWMVLTSFKTNAEMLNNPWGLPKTMMWSNYSSAWVEAELGHALLNSTLVSLGTLVLVICFSALAAYALTRYSFRWLTIVFFVLVFTMQTPTPIIPLYVEIARMGLTNTAWGLILIQAAGGMPLSTFIFRAFFQGIPGELLDAAKVDGCTEFTAFLRVVLPISGPAVATVGILQFVGTWNEYFLPLLMIRKPEMRTIPLAIQVFFYNWGRTEWAYVFASLSIATVPIIILYIILARQFIQGLTAGALKG